MPRIRTLKPEALQHRKVGPLSDRAFRVWVALVTHADDEGRVVATAAYVRTIAFGYQATSRLRDIEAAIQEVAQAGLCELYEPAPGGPGFSEYLSEEVAARDQVRTNSEPSSNQSLSRPRLAALHDWKDHQRINRPSPSRLPAPPSDAARTSATPFTEPSVKPSRSHSVNPGHRFSEHSVRTHAGSDRKGTTPLPPSPEPPAAPMPTGGLVGGRWPVEMFNTDCPEPIWRGKCVSSTWVADHPGEKFPSNGLKDDQGRYQPKQCPHHREEIAPAW